MKSVMVKLFGLSVLVYSSAVFAAEKVEPSADKCKGKAVVEIVTFTVNSGVSETQLIAAANKINADLAKQAGFISRNLAYDKAGEWVDIIHWRNLASAESAAQHMMQNEKVGEFFALIDQSKMKMAYYCAAK